MDRLELMRAFITVAEAGSFTEAARRLERSKTLVSKYVSTLEDSLGARLLQRTTRQVSLTDVGRAYLEQARDILGDIERLEDSVREDQGAPAGRLRVSAPKIFGERQLMLMVADFLDRFPEIELELSLEDRFVDIIAEGIDVAVRIGHLEDSTLVARRLSPVRILACASPSYLARRGMPSRPGDLRHHDLVLDTNFRAPNTWRFVENAKTTNLAVEGRLMVNSAEAARFAMVRGFGIGMAPEFAVADDLVNGRLVEVLAEHGGGYDSSIHLVYPHRLHLAARVRAFINFAADWVAKRPGWRESSSRALEREV